MSALWDISSGPWTNPARHALNIYSFPASRPPDSDQLRAEQLIELVAENAGLRAALAVSEGASVRRELVSQELKHRIGNLIAVVQAIARKSFHDADAIRLEDFNSRLSALTAAQTLLIDAETEPMSLLEVTRLALAPHISTAEQLAIAGPHVALNGRQAHALTLALHELATNAAKYGALSAEGGAVEVSWTNVENRIEFLWRECRGPPVQAPARSGFGSSLIRTNLSSAFSGVVDLRFEPGGVECRLCAPLPGAP